MDFLLPSAAIAGGILLLLLGGDRLVHHAAHLAVSYRVPKTVVGAVILGFGTSLPELVVSAMAAFEGRPSIAIGNVVGSNIANVGLILGVGAVMVTFHMQRRTIRTDLPLGVLAALFLLIWVGRSDWVSRFDGVLLLFGFALYLWGSLRYARRSRELDEAAAEPGKNLAGDVFRIVLGLVAITAGAQLLIFGAVEIARLLEVSELIIGLTMVALGTSLPELAALIAAARKGEADLALGNIAGSNIFNILFVLGVSAVITPIPVAPVMVERDFPVMAVFSVLAFPLLSRERRIGRTQGYVLLICFLGYVAWVWTWRG